jgi:hypothetical protein
MLIFDVMEKTTVTIYSTIEEARKDLERVHDAVLAHIPCILIQDKLIVTRDLSFASIYYQEYDQYDKTNRGCVDGWRLQIFHQSHSFKGGETKVNFPNSIRID